MERFESLPPEIQASYVPLEVIRKSEEAIHKAAVEMNERWEEIHSLPRKEADKLRDEILTKYQIEANKELYLIEEERKIMMVKFKVEILIDEEKVIEDDKYEPETMYEYIKNMFRKYELNEVETDSPNHIIFTDRGDNRDMAGLGLVAIHLAKFDWFRKYAKEFYWYTRNSDGSMTKGNIFEQLDAIKIKGM